MRYAGTCAATASNAVLGRIQTEGRLAARDFQGSNPSSLHKLSDANGTEAVRGRVE